MKPLNTKEESEGIAAILNVEPIIGKDALKSRVKALSSPKNTTYIYSWHIFAKRISEIERY
jgi:hypothetical protein